jgi:CheY-like chemotaxis protein
MRMPGSCDEHALLIVDDDESIRGFLCELLSTEGYSVKAARNGHEALTLLRGGFRPCLILLDLNMPVMDGRQFCAERDKRPDMASVPVALMSAGENLQDVRASCEPAAVFSKPFDLDRLVRTVEAIAD